MTGRLVSWDINLPVFVSKLKRTTYMVKLITTLRGCRDITNVTANAVSVKVFIEETLIAEVCKKQEDRIGEIKIELLDNQYEVTAKNEETNLYIMVNKLKEKEKKEELYYMYERSKVLETIQAMAEKHCDLKGEIVGTKIKELKKDWVFAWIFTSEKQILTVKMRFYQIGNKDEGISKKAKLKSVIIESYGQIAESLTKDERMIKFIRCKDAWQERQEGEKITQEKLLKEQFEKR